MKTIAVLAAMVPAMIAAAPAAAQADPESWTGFYAGGKIGYSFQPKDGDERLDFDTNLDGGFGDTVRTAAGANAFSPGFCGGAGLSSLPANGCSRDRDALTYAGMVGFDYQVPTMAGGGIVLGGKSWRGRGAAAEVGHIVVERNGARCMCGGRGCVEAYAGRAAMEQRAAWTGSDLDRLDAETTELNNHELRKRERPFVLRLNAADPEPVERAAYDASYKGVTDFLTLYLWRRLAFHLTRWAAKAQPIATRPGRTASVRS